MTVTAEEIRRRFSRLVEQGSSFENAIAGLSPALRTMPNPKNWQIMFDLLHWDWSENKLPIPIEELDRISKKYSPFGEHQEAIIAEQTAVAAQWQQQLNAAGMSPWQALGLAHSEAEFIVREEARNAAIGSHPSPMAVPQEIAFRYRLFYRAEKRWHPERTNALKPLLLAKEVIQQSPSVEENLVQEILGRICAHLNQVRAGTAKGRWVIADRAAERSEVYRFAQFMVYQVLGKRFAGDKSAFSGRGISLLEDACYAIYQLESDREV